MISEAGNAVFFVCYLLQAKVGFSLSTKISHPHPPVYIQCNGTLPIKIFMWMLGYNGLIMLSINIYKTDSSGP